jgi:5-methyltetrahydrofolate--homocysteine methyltransferase
LQEDKKTTIQDARKMGYQPQIPWESYSPPLPFSFDLQKIHSISWEMLSPFVDWSPLFWTWELKGTYPKIFHHPKYGVQAKELFDDAWALCTSIFGKKLIQPKGVWKIWPALSIGDDIYLYEYPTMDLPSLDQSYRKLHFLRQQKAHELHPQTYFCLSDFVLPYDQAANYFHKFHRMKWDYVGCFAVTAGDEIEHLINEFKRKGDDYQEILLKAVCDRVAEAMAEYMHYLVRRSWYTPNEEFALEKLLKDQYQGIRPAPGYPSCPDHSEKSTIWDLLQVSSQIGVSLTENYCMTPPSSVCGYYFSHPDSQYFQVGSLGKDQKEDYAFRKGITKQEVDRWDTSFI